jgi:hypothetical protein
MKNIILFLLFCGFGMPAAAESLAEDSTVVQLREIITTALSLNKNTPSTAIDIVTKHIDTTDDWAVKYMTGSELYGDDYDKKTMKYFSVIITKNGRTIVDNLAYDSKSKQLILSEVESMVLNINTGVENSKNMAEDEKYVKISESSGHTIFHKKGYLEDVAFTVNNSTQAILKSYSNLFTETIE